MNLLWDAARKCIDIAQWLSDKEQIRGWRKTKAWKKEIKRIFRISSRTCATG